ncbi:MAG: hypothetical protein HY824_11030 [Acidobacteria bacterium]|nr:hypothetical protein [Acidobacteriota bacterium]
MQIHHSPAWRGGILALACVCATGGTVFAQWLSLPLPGTPRTADGKPNLKAPTPRTPDRKPDLSGIWRRESARPNENLLPEGTDAPMLPWAAEIYKHRQETFGFERPMTFCMPHGVPDAVTSPYPFKILQTPGVTVVMYEEFHKYRQIHTDGRSLPVDPDPAWYGYSVGRWDGETFVVDTAGFKEGSWLDNGGHPHTEALRTTERFRRTSFGSLELGVTIDDPKAYSRPWTSAAMRFDVQPDTELLEHLCENNRDLESLQKAWSGRAGGPPSTGGQR